MNRRLRKIETAAMAVKEACDKSDNQDDWLLPLADLFEALKKQT